MAQNSPNYLFIAAREESTTIKQNSRRYTCDGGHLSCTIVRQTTARHNSTESVRWDRHGSYQLHLQEILAHSSAQCQAELLQLIDEVLLASG